MNAIGWTRRSSNAGPFRASNSHYAMNEGGMRQSRSIDVHSRIPLRSSSSQAVNKGGPPVFQQSKQRSKSHTPAVPGETPVQAGKITPSQSSLVSKITPGCSSTRTMKKMGYSKDNRNLHDKEYLKEAAFVVQRYFQEKCPELIVNGTDIRPMTIKMFIGMVNYLFAALEIVDKRQEPITFEVCTYEKELPYWMKKLNYPGLITKAWLQTVNVPNNWHHVIGLLSWLVKICEVSALFNFEDHFQNVDPYKVWSAYFFKQSLKAYRLFNEGNEEKYRELCREVVEKFCELNKFDEKENIQLQQEIDELRQKLEDPNALAEKDEFDEAVLKLKNLELQGDKLIEDISKKEDEIERSKAKILEKERNCDSLKSAIAEKREELENLKNVVSQQPTSISEIAELRKKSEYLDKEVEFLEKECDDLSQLISSYEFQAAGKRDAILQGTHAFNRNIIQLEQIVPELKAYRIYKDPEDEEIISEMENTVAALEELKKKKIHDHEDIQIQIKNEETGIEKTNQAIKRMCEDILKCEEEIEAQKKKNLTLQAEYEEKEKLLKEELSKWEQKTMAIQEKIQELATMKEGQQKLKLRHEELNRALEKTEKLAEEFWEKTVEKWKHIPESLETLVKMVKDQNVELKNGYSQLMTDLETDVNAKA